MAMEILAPAWNSHKLIKDLIVGGADAIYFGVRPSSAGPGRYSLFPVYVEFDLEAAKVALDRIRSAGKRAYITLNSLYHDAQLDGAVDLGRRLYEAGASAMIVADPGLAVRLKEVFPDGELHVSIQGRTLNADTALFWKGLGASRIVVERVLSLDQIVRVQQRAGIEVEVFFNGQFCFDYHAHCRMFNYFYGPACPAPCKEPAKIHGLSQAGQAPFRSKDLDAYTLLPQVVDSGIDALKIEGRLKSRRYILTMLAAARKAVDALERGESLPAAPEGLFSKIMARTTPGFYSGHLSVPESIERERRDALYYSTVMAEYFHPIGILWAKHRTQMVRRALKRGRLIRKLS